MEALSLSDERFAWTRPLIEPFAIDGRTLADFVAWVEREGGLEVRLGAGVEASLLEVRLRGDLIWTLPEEALATTLQLVGAGFRYDRGLVIIEN